MPCEIQPVKSCTPDQALRLALSNHPHMVVLTFTIPILHIAVLLLNPVRPCHLCPIARRKHLPHALPLPITRTES